MNTIKELLFPNPALASELSLQYADSFAQPSAAAYRDLDPIPITWGKHPRQSFDIFCPKDLSKPLPVFVFVHGGYWVNGSKEAVAFIAPKILSLPAIFVSLGYRLAPEFKYPAALEDCRLGLHELYKIIGKYGGDPNRIILGGHSAGGALVTLLSLQKTLLDPIPSSSVKGCVTLSSVFDMHDIPEKVKNAYLNSERDLVISSPVSCNIENRATVFHLFSGENDFPNIKNDQTRMLHKLKSSGVKADFVEVPGCNHFELLFEILKNNCAWLTCIQQLTDIER